MFNFISRKNLGIMEEEEFTIESDKPLVIDEKPQVLSIKPKKKPPAKHSYSTRATNVENELQVYYKFYLYSVCIN